MVRVWELEQQLGVPKSDPIFHLKKVNARVTELEHEARARGQLREAVEKSSLPKEAMSAPGAAATPAAARRAASKFTRAQMEEILLAVTKENRMMLSEKSDVELADHLDSTIAAINAPQEFKGLMPGMSRAVLGVKRERLDATLKKFKTTTK